MTREQTMVAELLRGAEASYGWEPYETKVVRYASAGADLFAMSDLHLGEGRNRAGTYARREKFFADESFGRLLAHLADRLGSKRGVLVLNGDVIDFLRITRVPATPGEFEQWRRNLELLGIDKSYEQLREISPKEMTYGLKTHDYKSVWKLSEVAEGHPEFLRALAGWLERGHRLVIVKGNHDLEWYWRGVRDRMRVILAEHTRSSSHDGLTKALAEIVLPNLRFVDHGMLVDERIYIEHGHMFDKYSHVLGAPTLGNGRELNLPFGSFFNRYLLNRIELAYPFFDNVRPRENLLPMLVREHFPSALKLAFQHIPLLILVIPKRYYRYMFAEFLLMVLAVGLPVAGLLWLEWGLVKELIGQVRAGAASVGILGNYALTGLKNLAVVALSYLLARLLAYLQLVEPDSLGRFAATRFEEHPEYEQITFGHTHNPDQVRSGGKWFFNTGTWVPVVEAASAAIRRDKTYTYLHIPNEGGSLRPGRLLRWNDDAGRSEPAELMVQAGKQ